MYNHTMVITVTPALREYLESKKKKNIVVEVATTDTSDFDVTEIFIRLCDHKHRTYLKEKQGYIEKYVDGVDPEEFSVLFKPYRMELSEEIVFDVKNVWFFKKIIFDGIKL